MLAVILIESNSYCYWNLTLKLLNANPIQSETDTNYASKLKRKLNFI